MGWEIHITRAEDWTESEQQPILLEEWLKVVELDFDLEINPEYIDTDPNLAQWLAHWIDEEEQYAWFNWWRGRISTQNPDRATLGKALEIASHLQARVLSEYGNQFLHPDELPE